MMNRSLIVLLFVLLVFSSCKKSEDTPDPTIITNTVFLEMGAGYANDIYYKLGVGVTKSVPRATWDIAFHTPMMSSTVITNGGSGVQLYTYTLGDTVAWSNNFNLDTAGLKSWKILYNSDSIWTMGAFERNTTTTLYDYGWGVYNTVNYNIVGDSLYIIKTRNGQFKKLWIKKKISIQNKWVIAYDNLGGGNLKTDTIDCNLYINKHFVYYSLETGSVLDREPDKSQWDLLVTKYVEMVPYGGAYVPYIVTGVLTNNMKLRNKNVISYTGLKVAQMDGVDVASNDYSAAKFQTSISTIGSDWKTLSYETNTYSIKSSVAYFLKKEDNSIYKIVFTKFAGSSTGALEFTETAY